MVREMRLRTEQLLGPPNQYETTQLIGKVKKIKMLRVEQRWFGLELLKNLGGELFYNLSFCESRCLETEIRSLIITQARQI
jgi:hypothetical protein